MFEFKEYQENKIVQLSLKVCKVTYVTLACYIISEGTP